MHIKSSGQSLTATCLDFVQEKSQKNIPSNFCHLSRLGNPRDPIFIVTNKNSYSFLDTEIEMKMFVLSFLVNSVFSVLRI